MLIALRWLAISMVLGSLTKGTVGARFIQKRQSAIGDIVTKALSIVEPIFNVNIDKHHLAQSDAVIPLGKLDALDPLLGNRDKQILDAPKYDSLDDVPICKGNSRICKFISCTAENFKSGESFDDLNTALQVLGDREMRQTISSDPDVMSVVCSERHLSRSQCSLFTSGFQLVDKFMTMIEDLKAKGRRRIVIDHSRDTGPTTERRTDTRRAPSHKHSSRSRMLSAPQSAWSPAARPAHRRTIFTTSSHHERTLARSKREDDYYDQVEKVEQRRGGRRGERRRHPVSTQTTGSSSRHLKIRGRHGGSAAISSATDGKTDYYSNYETEDLPKTSGGPLDCLKILGLS